jgi:hypothetical protein
MKKKLFLALMMCLPFMGFAQTQIINSWRDPAVTINDPGIHKIVVAALINDQGVRRQIEDYMVTLYPGVAIQSYQVMGGDSLVTDENAASLKFKSKGFDGIVIMKQVNESTSQEYIPGRMPTYYRTWNGYWGNRWGGPRWNVHYNPGTPDQVHKDWTWFVQVNVYSFITNKLIWSANTSTTDPGGRVPLFEDVCNAIHDRMTAEGFLQ